MPTDTHGLPDRQPVSSPGEALTFPDRGPHSPGGAGRRRQCLHTPADVTWNPKQMVGKTLNTEVQEEGLQRDADRCLPQKAQLETGSLNLRRSFQQSQEIVPKA